MYGAMGGFLFGFFFGLASVPGGDVPDAVKRRERILFWFAIVTAAVLYVLFFVLFYVVKDPPVKQWYFTDENATIEATVEPTTDTT